MLPTASMLVAGLHGAAAAEPARWTKKKHRSHSNFASRLFAFTADASQKTGRKFGKVKNMSRAGRSG